MKRLAVAAGLVTVIGLRSASAEPALEDVHIEYRAPKGCPTEPWVLGRILGRTDRIRQVAGDHAARTFSIEIVESGAGYSGTLEITEPEPEGRSTSRRIEATRCEEVADGLALIAALTIDPRAKLEAPDEKPAAAEPPIPEKRPQAPAPKPTPPPPRRTVPYLQLGVGFVGVSGAAPALLYGGELFVEAGRIAPRGWFSPGLRLTLRHARNDSVAFDQGTAHFRLSAIAADLCPLRAPVPTLGLRLCATGEVGRLDAQGSQAPDPQSRRGWAAVGSVLRASASTNRIGVEASIGCEAPLRRDRFVSDSQIAEVKLVVLFAGLAVTGRIN